MNFVDKAWACKIVERKSGSLGTIIVGERLYGIVVVVVSLAFFLSEDDVMVDGSWTVWWMSWSTRDLHESCPKGVECLGQNLPQTLHQGLVIENWVAPTPDLIEL